MVSKLHELDGFSARALDIEDVEHTFPNLLYKYKLLQAESDSTMTIHASTCATQLHGTNTEQQNGKTNKYS